MLKGKGSRGKPQVSLASNRTHEVRRGWYGANEVSDLPLLACSHSLGKYAEISV